MELENVEQVEEVAETNSGCLSKTVKTVAIVGLIALGGAFAYKYVIKPVINKVKMRREDNNVVDVDFNNSED